MNVIAKQLKEAESIISIISSLKDRVDDYPCGGQDEELEAILKRMYSSLDKSYDACDELISYLENMA